MPVLAPPVEVVPLNFGPLSGPHQRTQALLTSPLWRWSFSLPQGLPAGLEALLGRANPALTAPALLRQPLLTEDRAVLATVAQAGWLSQAPGVWLSVQGEAAETAIVPGLQGRTTIQAAVNLTAALQAVTPLPTHTDPVLVRWLVLLHEAGHTERGQLDQPFQYPGWPVTTICAFNALLFDSGDLMGPTRDRFDEAFADAFGARVLLQLTHNAPSARRAIAYLAQMRDTQIQGRPVGDEHGGGEVLRTVLHADFQAQTPDQVRQAAGADAGLTLVAWMARQPDPTWTWAQDPDAVVWATYRVRDYLEDRQVAYVWGQAGANALARAGQSPLLQALAAEDTGLATQFNARVSAASRQAYAHWLDAHPPGGRFIEGGLPDPHRQDPAFEAWLDEATAAALARHAALLGLDQAQFVTQAHEVLAQMAPTLDPVIVRPRRRP